MNNPSTCPHFSLCSGCELGKNFLHPPIWEKALRFFQSHNLTPHLHTDGFSQTRYKAKLAVSPSGQIGLFRKNSHDVVPIPHCLVHHSAINQAVLRVLEASPPAALRYLQFFVDQKSHLIQLTLVVNTPTTTPSIQKFCQKLQSYPIWHSIYINFNPASTNTIFSPSWELQFGEPFLWQTLNNTPIAFHPGAFSQAHLPLFEKMLQKMATWIDPDKPVLELYAGVGAIGLTLKSQVHLVENNPFAHLSFLESLKKHPKPNHFTYTIAEAQEVSLAENQQIIVDPPRKGLHPTLLQKLCKQKCSRLIYISCGYETFQRDSEALLSSGWKLIKAEGFLFFPGTNHVEILAQLEILQ